jgi:large subunit ribosomal protein L13
MKTWIAKEGAVPRKWWLVDASNQTVGRLATQIANVLRGKHKAEFTPHTDAGDFVVVVNSKNVKFSGNKWDVKKYYTHSRFFGSLKEKTAKEMLAETPEQILIEAVSGMLPKNKLSRQLIKKLKVYPGAEHPHSAQRPEALTLKN